MAERISGQRSCFGLLIALVLVPEELILVV